MFICVCDVKGPILTDIPGSLSCRSTHRPLKMIKQPTRANPKTSQAVIVIMLTVMMTAGVPNPEILTKWGQEARELKTH